MSGEVDDFFYMMSMSGEIEDPTQGNEKPVMDSLILENIITVKMAKSVQLRFR